MSRFQLLTDDQWALIADYLPAPTGKRGRPFSGSRQMIEGIIYRYRTGIAWRDLPETFGKWQTVWTWHRRLASDGTWDAIHQALTDFAVKNDKVDFTVSVDSTIARAYQHATNISRVKKGSSNYKDLLTESPDHAFGRSRGGLSTKTHQLVDGHGLPLVTICTAGQDGDSPMLAPLLENLKVGRRTRPDALLGDKAYLSKANRSLLRSRKIEAVISEPTDQQGHRLRRGSKGGGPPKFNAIKYKRRNVIERGYARMKQWRGLATRYDKLAIIYRAAIVLNGVIAWLQHLSDTP
ncbi:IS5 family transposase [Auritidibacter ignavus]|uniref:IS5 family transposase n=1 Tax=Auritidibacter ignavus TaxID=678932 RepID=UPI0024B9C382|nr:IS5 family transposase [Auritidibacter ignavus]WHS29038.1 IS5 family transposase [Auritidibacter ignavus]WHS35936.1 IS5 family transposase [Auritidibacter ignavus]